MGYPGKKRKSYDTPKHPWQAARMANEVELLKKYGLRNKKELWKAVSILRRYRADARRILAESAETELTGHLKTESDQILARLRRFSMLPSDANVDDILALQTEAILERRLQTQVYRLGLARTPKQARQFITHGHISIDGKKVTVPGMLISNSEEVQITT